MAVVWASALSAQTPVAPDWDLFCNRTIHFYEPAHGNQIEFFDPEGQSYLWYPGLDEAVPGEWRIWPPETSPEHEICFRYPQRFYNPVTQEYGGEWKCRTFSSFAEGLVNAGVKDGDAFGLSTLSVPFDLPAHPVADMDILQGLLPSGFTSPPASPAACADLLS